MNREEILTKRSDINEVDQTNEPTDVEGFPSEEKNKQRIKETAKYSQENFEILETLFSNTHFLIAFLDADLNFVRVNRAYARYMGQSPEFFIGKNHFDLFPHEENKTIFRQVLENGEPYTVFEKPFEFPSQPERGVTYWDWSLHPVKEDRGRATGLILSLVDVTRRKRAEEQFKIREKRYQDLLEQNLDGFIRMDMRGYIIESNQAFSHMVGYTADELKSLSINDLTPLGWFKREAKIFEGLFDVGHTPLYEKEYVSKEGNIVPVELRTYLTRDRKGNPVEMWALVRDITDKKEAEEKLQEYIGKLEKSNQELKEFAYVASHDLQEPLRKIQTFGGRLFSKYAEAMDETGRDYLERMVKAAGRMRDLIEALLTFSRVSSRGMHFALVDLNTALQEALSNLERRIEETEAELEIQKLPTLEADFVQMVQLMQNLIGNALKFHRQGVPPVVKVGYRIRQDKKRPRRKKDSTAGVCEIYVQDNGIGLKNEYDEQIFAPFQRLHGRTEYEGVGIGLAICRRIVERHGGNISVESQVGQGSTFFVTLPFVQTSP